MKKIFGDNDWEKSYVAKTEELEDELPFFDGTCDLCGDDSNVWFVFKNCGSGSMDSWICYACMKKITKMMKDEENQLV